MNIDEYPLPAKAIILIGDLIKSGKIEEKDAKILSSIILCYCELRNEVFYKE